MAERTMMGTIIAIIIIGVVLVIAIFGIIKLNASGLLKDIFPDFEKKDRLVGYNEEFFLENPDLIVYYLDIVKITSLSEDFYYRYVFFPGDREEKIGKWQFSKDKKEWISTETIISNREFEKLLGKDDDVKKRELRFVNQLNDKSPEEGLKLIVQRVLDNKESNFFRDVRLTIKIGNTEEGYDKDSKILLDLDGLIDRLNQISKRVVRNRGDENIIQQTQQTEIKYDLKDLFRDREIILIPDKYMFTNDRLGEDFKEIKESVLNNPEKLIITGNIKSAYLRAISTWFKKKDLSQKLKGSVKAITIDINPTHAEALGNGMITISSRNFGGLTHEAAHTLTAEYETTISENSLRYKEEYETIKKELVEKGHTETMADQLTKEILRYKKVNLFIEQWASITGDAYRKNKFAQEWDDGTSGPRYGLVEPYGSESINEDIATFTEKAYKNPDFFKPLIKKEGVQYDERYRKKLDLLKEYGFITLELYNTITSN